jgi:hypothetical protein
MSRGSGLTYRYRMLGMVRKSRGRIIRLMKAIIQGPGRSDPHSALYLPLKKNLAYSSKGVMGGWMVS